MPIICGAARHVALQSLQACLPEKGTSNAFGDLWKAVAHHASDLWSWGSCRIAAKLLLKVLHDRKGFELLRALR
jgi:hypothetical protein